MTHIFHEAWIEKGLCLADRRRLDPKNILANEMVDALLPLNAYRPRELPGSAFDGGGSR